MIRVITFDTIFVRIIMKKQLNLNEYSDDNNFHRPSLKLLLTFWFSGPNLYKY